MKAMNCKFCSDLKDRKSLNREMHEDVIALGGKPHRSYYSIALVETWAKGTGQTTYYGYKLNYCPECGRYLKRSKPK